MSSSTNTHQDLISAKEFRSLNARFALQGPTLYKSNLADGRVLYLIERMVLMQLATIDIAMGVLAKLEARRC